MSEEKLKVAVIGGGSSYTPEFIDGVIRHYDSLPIREITLVDIPHGERKLEIVGNLARRMVEAAGLPIAITTTLNRRAAIADADYVTTQLRVGQLSARSLDEHIPLALGHIGQETTGAGGFANALRTIPVILDICRDMEELAPNAVLLNFTNPSGIVTQAALQYSSIQTIGLCNLPITTKMHLAELYRVPPTDVETEVVGLNHLHWTTDVRISGRDAMTEVLDRLIEGVDERLDVLEFHWDSELLRSIRAIPCSYLRYYYHPDDMLADERCALAAGGTRAEVVQKIENDLFQLYADPTLTGKPEQLSQRGGAYYSEVAVNLMESMWQSRGDVQTVNVRNGSAVPFLSPDAVIEVNCRIDREGAHPLPVRTEVSPAIRGLIQVVKAYEELTVAAAVSGDYDKALQALVTHPLVSSISEAKRLLGALLHYEAEWLPQFATVRK